MSLVAFVVVPGLVPALMALSTTVTVSTLLLYNNTVVNGTYTGPVGGANWQLTSAVYDPATGLIYALNPPQKAVAVFSPTNYSYLGSIAVGLSPAWISLNPNGTIYVSDSQAGTIDLIDPSTWKVFDAIFVGNSPGIFVYDPSNGYLYVANDLGNNKYEVQVVGPHGVVSSIPLPGVPSSMVYDPVNNYVVVATNAGVFAIEGFKVVHNYTSTNYKGTYTAFPQFLVVDPDTGTIYGVSSVSVGFGNTYTNVLAFSPSDLSVVKYIQVRPAIAPLSSAVYINGRIYLLSGSQIYYVNLANGSYGLVLGLPQVTVTGASTNMDFMTYAPKLDSLVLVGEPPTPLFLVNLSTLRYFGIGVTIDDPAGAYDPATGYYYVVNSYSSAIYAVDPNTTHVVRVFQSVYEATAITSDPTSGTLYVASSYTGEVAAVDPDTGQLVWNSSAGKSPFMVLYDPVDGLLYVSSTGSGIVSVVNPDNGEYLAGVPVGLQPTWMALDPISGAVFVLSQGNSSVSVIHGANVTETIRLNFTPTSLAYGNGTLFVGSSKPKTGVYVYSLKEGKFVSFIPLQYAPSYLGYYGGLVYAIEANGKTGTLVVLNATTGASVTAVDVGPSPTSLTVVGDRVFLTNGAQGTVTVVSFAPPTVKEVNSTSTATATTQSTTTRAGTTTTSPPTGTTASTATHTTAPVVQTTVPPPPPSPFSVIPRDDIVIIVVVVVAAAAAFIVFRSRLLSK